MQAIDTNVLLRLLTQDDRRQSTVAEAFIEKAAWVPILALAEGIWVFRTVYKRSPGEIATTVEMLLRHRYLVLQDADTVAAAVDVYREHSSVGFSDCLMLELARKAGNLPLG